MRNCYGLGLSASGGMCGAGLEFFVWDRFARYAGMEGTRGSVSKTASLSSRACAECGSDEPEHGDNLARTVFVQPKHAQDKSCGLRRRFRRAWKGAFPIRFSALFHMKHSVLREGNADIRTVAAKSKTVRAELESSFLTVICFTWNNGETVLGKPLFQMRA